MLFWSFTYDWAILNINWPYKLKSDLKKDLEWFSMIEVGKRIRLSF